MVHERAIGKTISAVYLGDSKRFRAVVPEDHPPDGIFRGEYLAFKFTDGSALVLEVGSGNSFSVDPDAKELKRAKAAAKRNATRKAAEPKVVTKESKTCRRSTK